MKLALFVAAVGMTVWSVRLAGAAEQRSANTPASNAESPTVGMEGRLEVLLPIAGLVTKAPDHKTPVLLRIASAQPHGALTRYDLRYIGRVPGRHDLRNYLFTADNLPATNLPALFVSVTGLLPEKHNGWLEDQRAHAPTLFGSYRVLVVAVLVLWVLAFVAILRLGRKPMARAVETAAPRAPTFAERLRPLLERAAAGQLSADDQAALERMLISHWQRRLNLGAAGGAELMATLRQHPEAGVLLRALEDWLHRPPGRAVAPVDAVLAPYRNLPAEAPAEATV